jgi:predicted secreted protein
MSVPTQFDFAVIKIGDGAMPETFPIACGIQDVTINQTAQSSDTYVRDCDKPGEIPQRQVKFTGKALDITGTGLIDKAQVAVFTNALAKRKNYIVECYTDDGTDAGDLQGEFEGTFGMEAFNLSIPRDGDGSAEITLKSHGAWTWTPAA